MTTDHTSLALLEVADWWTELEDDLVPGTGRRWTERQQDVDEHGHRVPLPGETRCSSCGSERQRTPAFRVPGQPDRMLPGKLYCPRGCDSSTGAALGRPPARMDVLAALADLTTGALTLEQDVREHLGEPMRRHDTRDRLHPASSTSTDAPLDPRVPDALRWLALHHGRITDPQLRRRTADDAHRMARALRSAVGAQERVVQLRQPCPQCGHLSLAGFLDRCPANGYGRCRDSSCQAAHGVVFCTANDGVSEPLCVCEREDCSCHEGGRHYWNPEEFRHLGLVLDAS